MKNAMKCFMTLMAITSLVFAQSETELEPFKKALALYKKSKYEEAIPAFEALTKQNVSLDEYVHFYLGQSLFKTNKLDAAEIEFNKVLKMSPNIKMTIESSNYLGQIALDKKNFKLAKNIFTKLESRTKNQEEYPEVIYYLAAAEKGLSQRASMCRWLSKLYEKFPSYPKIQNWGEDLAANDFLGEPTGCSLAIDDFRTRVRYLLWAGLDRKAQAEISSIRNKLGTDDPFTSDKLQAQYYIQEGELNKAVDLLKPYYENKKKSFEYLILFASTAARAGEVQTAVGSYYSAYKLNPRSQTGKQALYQSAFLSYQFQDYDGAARRFQEFMKVYPTSGLIRDAQWHLAWLKYLKGDYQGAYKAFAGLNTVKIKRKKNRGSILQERSTYWMAMSLYRQGKMNQAKILLESLAKDPLFGYYAIAAQARLKKIGTIKSDVSATQLPTQPTMISRFSTNEFLMPSFQEDYRGDDSESEENLILTQYSAEDENGEEEEADATDNPDLKSVDVADDDASAETDKSSGFSSPVLMKRFERARDMMILGENEWARWDLFDIEMKTRNKEYLRTLMTEYNTAENYNRSSYIAQISFAGQRAAHGLEGIRYLWELAYPRAYSESVEKYSKKFSVPEEFVWGIMRAETNYRRDAISPVGALGLMQVMPFTGHKLANLLGEKNFSAPMLLEPETAVKYGSRYLKRLMDRFDNTIPLAAAGYNAGPHRVKNWLISFGNLETDEFIEHIPFLETRNYVKRVVSNAFIYGQLYGNKKNLFPYLSDSVPVKVNAEIVGKENWDEI